MRVILLLLKTAFAVIAATAMVGIKVFLHVVKYILIGCAGIFYSIK